MAQTTVKILGSKRSLTMVAPRETDKLFAEFT